MMMHDNSSLRKDLIQQTQDFWYIELHIFEVEQMLIVLLLHERR